MGEGVKYSSILKSAYTNLYIHCKVLVLWSYGDIKLDYNTSHAANQHGWSLHNINIFERCIYFPSQRMTAGRLATVILNVNKIIGIIRVENTIIIEIKDAQSRFFFLRCDVH